MHILRMRQAAIVRRGEHVVSPTSIDLAPGERATRDCRDDREAEGLAMMAAALARATAGSVLIGEYDPRVQPVHCKRIAAFVAHDPLPLSRIDAERYIAHRAALFDLDLERARAHARLLLERLRGLHEAFAYPLVGALVANPRLLVLDRPQPASLPDILEAAAGCAILVTQTQDRA
jgi:hypothetical protein